MKDIAKKSNTLALLEQYGLAPNKKFGQNFLIDMNMITKIVESYALDKDTCVIEIGPGIGALTEQLARRSGHVEAFEVDLSLVNVLDELQKEYPNVHVTFQNILTVDLNEVVSTLKQQYAKVKVIANLPYYITTDILEHIIKSNAQIESIHAMVQLEVADKLTSNKYISPLTLMIDSVGYAYKEIKVPRTVFYPAPHVDSAILSIMKEKDLNIKLFELLKQSFTQKRKTIYNNLKGVFKTQTEEILNKCNIDPKLRPEQITIDQYLKLCDYVQGEQLNENKSLCKN